VRHGVVTIERQASIPANLGSQKGETARMRGKKWFLVICMLSALLGLTLAPVIQADDGSLAVELRPTGTPGAIRPQPIVRWQGLVVSRPSDTKIGTWVVGQRSVDVVESTRFIETRGAAEVGAKVEVLALRLATTSNSTSELEAILIVVLAPAPQQPIVIRGRVTELGADYLIVNRQRIHFDSTTEITGELVLGAVVKVEAVRMSAGGLHAQSIEVLPDPSPPIVEFEGLIESIGHPEWVIGGRTVTVDRRTRIVGRAEVGLTAKVRALQLPDGRLVALLIEVQNEPEPVEWTGVILHLPAETTVVPTYLRRWVVGGRPVMVNAQTEIVGTPRIGLRAHVIAVADGQRQLVATKIEIVVEAL